MILSLVLEFLKLICLVNRWRLCTIEYEIICSLAFHTIGFILVGLIINDTIQI